MGELLVHTEHICHLASAYAYVAGGDVFVRADVAVKLAHEGLAEAHDLGVALAARGEVRATLGAAHGQGGERVLERLLEGEELQDALVYRLVEPYTSLVRADDVVVLHAVAHICLHLALVVNPCHAELHNPVGDAEALDEVRTVKFRVLVILFFDSS